MPRTSLNLIIALGCLLAVALACNFSSSTANISAVKIGKDKNVKEEATTFESTDPFYVVATISNAPNKVKVKGRLVVEEAEGQTSGPVPGLEKTLDLDGSGTATYSFTPPPNGWAKGKYKVEIIMMNEAGEQKDQKSVSFSVS
jgi:hypothetical protein